MRAGGAGAILAVARFVGTASAGPSGDGRSNGWMGRGDGLTLGGDLADLLRRTRLWPSALPEGYFDDVQESQDPTVTSVCCSDSRVSQGGMFLAPLGAGFPFKPSNIGNTVISLVDGERVVDGDVLYGLENADSESGAVVGHTDCGAITAAYTRHRREPRRTAGHRSRAASARRYRRGRTRQRPRRHRRLRGEIINQLVEYNVNRQIEFLVESSEISDDRNLYGFVYDFQGAYADARGRTYLVNVDGETDQDELQRARIGRTCSSAVSSGNRTVGGAGGHRRQYDGDSTTRTDRISNRPIHIRNTI